MRDPLLEAREVAERLERLPGWELSEDGRTIRRRFSFPGFGRAFAFMTECAIAADKLDHHPDWSNSYNRVDVTLTTHDSGGLTYRDLALAELMQKAAERRD